MENLKNHHTVVPFPLMAVKKRTRRTHHHLSWPNACNEKYWEMCLPAKCNVHDIWKRWFKNSGKWTCRLMLLPIYWCYILTFWWHKTSQCQHLINFWPSLPPPPFWKKSQKIWEHEGSKFGANLMYFLPAWMAQKEKARWPDQSRDCGFIFFVCNLLFHSIINSFSDPFLSWNRFIYKVDSVIVV